MSNEQHPQHFTDTHSAINYWLKADKEKIEMQQHKINTHPIVNTFKQLKQMEDDIRLMYVQEHFQSEVEYLLVLKSVQQAQLKVYDYLCTLYGSDKAYRITR